MELIVIKSLRKLGKIGDTINVKKGYGRNFLIPQKFAIRATENNKLLITEQKKNLEDKDNSLYLQAKEVSHIIKDKELIFIRQAAEDGKLFGSVNIKEIAKSLSSISNIEIAYSQIYLVSPIKYVGVHIVEVVLHADEVVNIKLVVARTESEAQQLLVAANVTTIPSTDESIIN